jgi:protein O-GlcNAc transferase
MAKMTLEQILAEAIQLHQAGKLPAAAAMYRQILVVDPQQPDALHLLGVIAHQSGQSELAEQLLNRALQLRPGWVEAGANLSQILQKKGDFLRNDGKLNSAIDTYRRAISLKADSPAAINSLGAALQARGELRQAIACYRSAIALSPGYGEPHSNLAVALRALGEMNEAVIAARQAVALAPANAVAVNNLGLVLRDAGKLSEAIACHERAMKLDASLAEAVTGLGGALLDAGEIDRAIAAYQQGIAIKPDDAISHFNLGKTFMTAGDSAAARAAFGQACALQPANASFASAKISVLFYQPGLTPTAIAEEHFRWGREHAALPVRSICLSNKSRASDRRLRIGYVSPDIRQHPVGRFLLPILETHDRARFEIFIYSDARVSDGISARSKSAAEHWLDSARLTHEELAEQIRRDHIDILIDLCGHTTGSRLLMFARKPAAVQATYLGYPGTTGVAAIDYRFTDAMADPVGMTEPLHVEKLYRLPRTNWCFMETERSPDAGPLPLLGGGGVVTFGSCNNVAKITDQMLGVWSTILQQVPRSRLLIKSMTLASAGARSRIEQVMVGDGIDPGRLTLVGPTVNHHEHLGIYRRIDIALDTFPYHGTTTTCDALWMGVPVVTLGGAAHVSRVGVSLLTALGRPEWIANTGEEYVRIAVEMACDAAGLGDIRQNLRQQMQASALMDAPGFCRDLEKGLESMWAAHCAAG